MVGAVCDLTENVLVITNIARRDELTDGWIDAMRSLGNVKWLFGLGGAVVLIVLLITDRTQRRKPGDLAEAA